MEYSLTISNKDVFDFYSKYGIDFEAMNVIIVDVLKQLVAGTDPTLNSAVASQLLSQISSLSQRVDTMSSVVSKNNEVVSKQHEDKMNEFRRQYIEDIKILFMTNNAEHIAPLMREVNSSFLDKTTILLHEMLPKGGDTKSIAEHMETVQSLIMERTSQLLSANLEHVSKTDPRFESLLLATEMRIDGKIASSEGRIEIQLTKTDAKMSEILQRTDGSFKEIKTICMNGNSASEQLHGHVSDILKKFENGSSKGAMSENITYSIILGLFPSAQIDLVSQEKETGDIMLVREGRPKILIENKDHETKNVTKLEVEKFIRDCEFQSCSGIMFAQHRGIANKYNFEVQIHKCNVLLYVHCVSFDVDKMKTAIDIVDQFKTRLDEINADQDGSFLVTKEQLDDMSKDYSQFVLQKLALTKVAKEGFDRTMSSIGDFQMPHLEKYLRSQVAFSSGTSSSSAAIASASASASTSTSNPGNACEFCKKIIPKSMSQHQRYCAAKKDFVPAIKLDVSIAI